MIHEPFIALTDFILFLECAFMYFFLVSEKHGGFKEQFLFLASSSLFGAIFHAFFPLKDKTPFGLTVWVLVCLSIAMTSFFMVRVMAKEIHPRMQKIILVLTGISVLCFLFYIVGVDRTYPVVLSYYGPILLSYVLFSLWMIRKNIYWGYVTLGLHISVVAGVLQSMHVSIMSLRIDHNTLYHLVQMIALGVLFWGYRRLQSLPVSQVTPTLS